MVCPRQAGGHWQHLMGLLNLYLLLRTTETIFTTLKQFVRAYIEKLIYCCSEYVGPSIMKVFNHYIRMGKTGDYVIFSSVAFPTRNQEHIYVG